MGVVVCTAACGTSFIRSRDLRKNVNAKGVPNYENTIACRNCAAQSAGPWARGGEPTIRALTTKPYVNGPDGIGGPFRGGFHAAMADGSVKFISEKTDPKVLEAIATIHGGEVVGDY